MACAARSSSRNFQGHAIIRRISRGPAARGSSLGKASFDISRRLPLQLRFQALTPVMPAWPGEGSATDPYH